MALMTLPDPTPAIVQDLALAKRAVDADIVDVRARVRRGRSLLSWWPEGGMGDNSVIEWTDATWNAVTGCTTVSPGGKHCYAERLALRLRAMGNPRYRRGFAVTLHPDQRIRRPLCAASNPTPRSRHTGRQKR
jgi:Protein of unknown function (DUF5131)